MKRFNCAAFFLVAALLPFWVARGQSPDDLTIFSNLFQMLSDERAIQQDSLRLGGSAAHIDNMGNLIVAFGTGAPHRLIVAPMDTPYYLVSGITPDGYLRVQRLPQAAPNSVFDSLNFAQPLFVETRDEPFFVRGVFAGLSVHLAPGRNNAPKMNNVEDLFIDIGAKSNEEVRKAGVDVLDRIFQPHRLRDLGREHAYEAGSGVGDQFGAVALAELLRTLDQGKNKQNLRGTTTIAFVTQSWEGGRGLNRLLQEIPADEMVYLARLGRTGNDANGETPTVADLGQGVLLVVDNAQQPPNLLAARMQDIAAKQKVPLKTVTGQRPRLAAYAKASSFPPRFTQLSIEIAWPVTPAETASLKDVVNLEKLLEGYLDITSEPRKVISGGRPGCEMQEPCPASMPPLPGLVEAYGASGHEEAVREEVRKFLPTWAAKQATTDAAGNLVLHLGDANKDGKTPRIAFVAHMDEIGFEVKKIEDDGRLQVDSLGGGYPQYFLGHVALVHKKDGSTTGAVMELPAGWDKPGFEMPNSPRSIDEPAHVYVGTQTKEETEKLGIAVGDYLTIPKQYVPLLGTRANARSFDDRVGCAALITAVRALGPELPGRDVTFVWSTEEEVGLKGAAAFAEQAAKEGRVPDFVFAIDTFVSSDSPLESKRFGDAELGRGFVVRAVDNSNIVPLQYVDRVLALAKEANIPAQYGVTGGGNDGSVFTRYGSVDVALGWPLRYSHSPAEVIDTKDLDALSKIVEVIARKW